MAKFKTGDKVECIESNPAENMHKRGWQGTVDADGTECPPIEWDNGKRTCCSEKRLKLIKKEGESMDKYIIYTMGVKEINEAVQKILFEKGYKWGSGMQDTLNRADFLTLNGEIIIYGINECPISPHGYKELTFRELMELPPVLVHDEEEELAERIVGFIENCTIPQRKTRLETQIGFKDGILSFKDWTKKQDWCAIWEKMKPKLGL